MSEANRDEVDKCKQIAKTAIATGDCAKAIRFLEKAKRMSPGDSQIDALLAKAAEGPGDDMPGRPEPQASREGPRFRGAADNGARSKPDTQSSAPRPRAPPPKAELNYTREQMADVQRILRTKDYYEMLNIPKDSPEEAVKKAYKKSALKLHPDKNQAPGAEEAFKKLSKAVQCLTDKDKKQMYDRYGDEEHMPQQQRQHYQQDFMTPEDLFNVFFGGGAFNMNQQQGRAPHQEERGEAGPQVVHAHVFQMLPVILLVLLTLASNFASRDTGSRFSFTPNGNYQSERSTATLNVPYYVTGDFENHYSEGTRSLSEFERQVDVYYVRNLHSECDYQEKVMYKKVMLAKRRNDKDELDKARNHPRPSCKEIEKIKKRHLSTYRAAMHMGY